ncbi:LysM peptidoglycan-binding domain-containing protein [Paucibacter sp. B51]|uniref:VgrG-related protein n=1 Tax=Paucibacter sp. B51 TaxID=2993315 RepID=UPI0022EC06D6|nr:LysM peptidoglycan-binding domain-containing protein [Paucibacter sp. B51]
MNLTNPSYRVHSGDTLSRIAKNHGISAEALMQANGMDPKLADGRVGSSPRDPDRLRVGQVLRIPVATPGLEREHRVVPGETLPGIAEHWGVDLKKLLLANPLVEAVKSLLARLEAPAASAQAAAAPSAERPAANNNGGGLNADTELGKLSARYESGRRGSAAIGYDNTGGWSYGKYQIETQRGTMAKFLDHAATHAPEMHQALKAAGGLEAARAGTAEFKKAWVTLAADPRFAALQHSFIASRHYEPLAARLKAEQGLDLSQRSAALRDVVWSVAVQHGSGSSVIAKALAGRDVSQLKDADIINAIYDERGAEKLDKSGKTVLKYFSKSTDDVQAGVRHRFEQERKQALQMLSPFPAAPHRP